MTETIKKTWKLLEKTIEINSEMKLNTNSYEQYKANFEKWVDVIKTTFMTKDVRYLDRHKVAAIIIISILESNAVASLGDVPAQKTFIGQYQAALSVGLTYMQNRLNEVLVRKKQKTVDKIWMPDFVFSCEVRYFDIAARNLYFAQQKLECGLNPLGIAKELFLLEFITVEKAGIDPRILKEDKKKGNKQDLLC